MATQKYQLGELVCVVDTSGTDPTANDVFRIINSFLMEGRTRVYRLQQLESAVERVVHERELRLASGRETL
jgi:hypothetical protein